MVWCGVCVCVCVCVCVVCVCVCGVHVCVVCVTLRTQVIVRVSFLVVCLLYKFTKIYW